MKTSPLDSTFTSDPQIEGHRASHINEDGDTVMYVKLDAMKRLENTVNGNARYKLKTSRGVYLTEPDASEIIALTGHEARHGGFVEMVVNQNSRVESVRCL